MCARAITGRLGQNREQHFHQKRWQNGVLCFFGQNILRNGWRRDKSMGSVLKCGWLTFDSAQSNSSWRELRYGMNFSSSSKMSPFCSGMSPAPACESILLAAGCCAPGAAVGMPVWNNRSNSMSQLAVLIATNATAEGDKNQNPFHGWESTFCVHNNWSMISDLPTTKHANLLMIVYLPKRNKKNKLKSENPMRSTPTAFTITDAACAMTVCVCVFSLKRTANGQGHRYVCILTWKRKSSSNRLLECSSAWYVRKHVFRTSRPAAPKSSLGFFYVSNIYFI